ncbi:MAG: M4 family metallopeptidase [Bacteroidia bacterium]
MLLGAFSFQSTKAQFKILEADYNDKNEIVSLLPDKSWSRANDGQLPEIFSKIYSLSSTPTLRLISKSEEKNSIVLRYQQTLNGYDVDGGEIIILRINGEIMGILGRLVNFSESSIPLISGPDALKKVLEFLGSEKKYLWEDKEEEFLLKEAKEDSSATYYPTGRLIYTRNIWTLNNSYNLCYEFEIYTATPERIFIYINAVTGNIEYNYNAITHANGTGTALYHGNVNIKTAKINDTTFYLHDSLRKIFTWDKKTTTGGSYWEFVDKDNSFTSNNSKSGVAAHYGIGIAYDYYKTKWGRNSYDGAGAKLINRVHYGVNYDNAFWNGVNMTYGDGDGADNGPCVSQDWVGHEITHGYTEKTANLVYQGEPGALNEAWSDIMAMLIENYGGDKDWLIFEDANTLSNPNDNERDMSNPSNGRIPQPDTYKGTHWASTTGGDNGGVHGNSGVANFWFYLLSEGGNGTNDKGKQYAVSGIGLAKAEKIAWRTLEKFMVRHTDFAGARKASLLACEYLGYDKKSNEYKQVCNAWFAVGVGEKCCDPNDYTLTFKLKDTKCHDSKDGEIELKVKKLNNNNYDSCTYKWFKGDTSSAILAVTRDLFNRDSGRYIVIVKDTVAKCEIVEKTTIKSPEKVKVSISGGGEYQGACKRSITVVLTASASGGNSPYTYNWANALQEIILSGSSGFTHDYTAVGTDKNGCKGEQTAKVVYIPVTCSYDPNDIIGPPSFGDPKWVSINATLPYKIRYENDPKFATGPAQKVSINHKLDTNTDLTSFRLMSFGFYKYSFDVPENATTFSKRLDLRDSFGIFLDVTAGLDVSAREAFWIFESIDPATGLPPTNGNKGYLAVNDTITHKGEGFVNYSIMAKKTAKTGDSIRAKAIIVFDDNSAVPTPRIFNLIDAKPPTTYIKTVPTIIDSTIVTMTLRGKDDTGGSGMGNFDVYVSENGGGYNRYAKAIADTMINFRGNYGSDYKAYSIGYDNVENREKDKTAHDISFSIASKEFFRPITPSTSLCSGDTLRLRWVRSFVSSITFQYSADSGKTFNTFATGLGGTDTLYRWRIPSNIIGIKKYIVRAVNSSNSSIIDTSDFFQLKQGPAISLGPDTAFCDGASFSLTLNPGSGYSSYKWSDSSTTSTKTVTAYGTYWVKVKASTGCKATEEITVSKNLLPQIASVNNTSPLCFGESNGIIDITVVSGHAPYKYLWSNAATSQDLTNIVAGNYSVTVTDSKGCVANETTTLSQPSKLAKSHTITFVKCFGGNDGSVDVTITGGTTPYTYIWSNAATSQDISSLVAGTYRLEVTDKNNCVIRDTSIVTQPSAPVSSTFSQVNVVCNGGTTGSINLTPAGGTTPYTFAWTGPGSFTATTEDISSLAAGTYNVVITDANGTTGGCRATNSVTITQPSAPVSSTFNQVNVLCNGGTTGSINLTPTGGTTPYTFAWTGPGSFTATTEDIGGLAAGTYNVVITDANGTTGGCRATNSVTITQPTLLIISNSVTDVKCFAQSNGGVNATISGGVTPYSFNWTNGSTTEDIVNVVAGSYSLTVTDNNGCTIQTTGTVNQPALLVATHSIGDVKCYNGSDGAINLLVIGGITPYVYLWNSSDITEDISSKPTGTYKVTVTDKNLCIVKDSGFISQPAAPLSSTIAMVPVNCFGGSDGSANLSVAGGTSPYSFAWSNGKTTEDLSGLTLGTYYVNITDANSCVLLDTIDVTQPLAPLATSIIKLDVKCFAGNDGSANLNVSGGTTPYSFAWSNSATTEDISGLVLGKYIVTVTDKNLCKIKDSVVINQPAAPLSSVITPSPVNCFGGGDGGATLTVSGGTPNYSYSWSNGATTKDITSLLTGKYKVTVTDGNSCILKDSIIVTQPIAPLAATHIVSDAKCKNSTNGGINLNVTGGTLPYLFVWSNTQTSEDAINLGAGRYFVNITDKNGCKLKDSANVGEPDSLKINADGTTATEGESNGFVFVTVIGGTQPYTYFWNGSTTGANDTLFNKPFGAYIVRVVDGNGCSQTDTFIIEEAPPTSLLRLGPNPSRGSLTVFDLESFGLDLPIYFELWDMEGRLRMDFMVEGLSMYTFPLDDSLYNDFYILRIYNDRYEERRKIYLLR